MVVILYDKMNVPDIEGKMTVQEWAEGHEVLLFGPFPSSRQAEEWMEDNPQLFGDVGCMRVETTIYELPYYGEE